ncbi:MAG TPA: hypothetical protein PLZ36_15860, partial [Armatimonadota bacterium]|nr:hypothetical protein [Armatimonadota bacterium]
MHDHLPADDHAHGIGHDHHDALAPADHGWLPGGDTHTVPDFHTEHLGADHATAALSHGLHVPWQQVTPSAMHHDADGDGIPDALDNHVGPGA